jgi:hypothetical protein
MPSDAASAIRRIVAGRRLVALLLITAAAGAPSSLRSEAAAGWELRDYRAARVETGGETPTLRDAAPALKLDQVSVIRRVLAPGEHASLIAQYSVTGPAAIEVKETRIVRFSDTVLLSRDTVVTRAAGQWRSEFALRIPRGAAEGLYRLTTKIEAVGPRSATGVAEEKTLEFAVDSAAPPPPADASSAPPAAAPASPPTASATKPAAAAPPTMAAPAPTAAPPPPTTAASPPTAVAPTPPPARPPAAGGDTLRINLWTDKQRYRIGDNVTFHFETNRKGYVTLVNAGTSGAVTILFPNRFSQGQEVNGKTVYSIPRSEDGYAMNVSGPPGIELVYALLTLEPLKFAETNFSQTRSIFRSVDGGSLTRDINAVVKQTAADKQAKAMIELEVVK